MEGYVWVRLQLREIWIKPSAQRLWYSGICSGRYVESVGKEATSQRSRVAVKRGERSPTGKGKEEFLHMWAYRDDSHSRSDLPQTCNFDASLQEAWQYLVQLQRRGPQLSSMTERTLIWGQLLNTHTERVAIHPSARWLCARNWCWEGAQEASWTKKRVTCSCPVSNSSVGSVGYLFFPDK